MKIRHLLYILIALTLLTSAVKDEFTPAERQQISIETPGLFEQSEAFTIDFGGAASTEATVPQDQPAEEASGAQSSGEVTPEFKEMMDSYEAFMNQYCDFMVKYVNATNSGDSATLLAMTADYANLVQQELDWASKIDGIDESTLSPADDAYYLEVQGRVLKKLGETGVSLS